MGALRGLQPRLRLNLDDLKAPRDKNNGGAPSPTNYLTTQSGQILTTQSGAALEARSNA